MLRRLAQMIVTLAAAGAAGLAARPACGQYRGMTPGWPNYTSGYYAGYAPSYGYPQAYAARPVQYVPVQAAYANPAYYGNYPRVAAGYQPATAYYAPAQQAYAPTAAYYAPAPSYSVSPAGNVSAGAEAYAGYGQPTRVNYVPPRFTYRTVYSPATVYSYRPVTAYDPIAGQPTTCYQVATTTQCQPAREQRHCLWWLNPHNWFSHSWGGSGGGCCGAPAVAPVVAVPTTSYCGTACYQATTCGTASCGQPYYPVQPVVPVIPAAPANTIPSIRSTIPATPTVPAPPTRFPATTVPGTVIPGTALPADIRPSLGPGGSFTPVPGSTITPAPGSSFPSGGNYPPVTDPYVPLGASGSNGTGGTAKSSTAKSSGSFSTDPRELDMTGPILRQPGVSGASSALHPDVQPVPDPAATQPSRAINRAPQLLDPRDKSASRGDLRWAVVPAVWPKPSSAEPRYQQRSLTTGAPTAVQPATSAVVNPAEYDDGGWKSAGF